MPTFEQVLSRDVFLRPLWVLLLPRHEADLGSLLEGEGEVGGELPGGGGGGAAARVDG